VVVEVVVGGEGLELITVSVLVHLLTLRGDCGGVGSEQARD